MSKFVWMFGLMSLAAGWHFWSEGQRYPEWSKYKAYFDAQTVAATGDSFLYATGGIGCAPPVEPRFRDRIAEFEQRTIPGTCGCILYDLDQRAAKIEYVRAFNSAMLALNEDL